MTDAPAWLRDRRSYHAVRLFALSQLADAARVTCPICAEATARSTELCGCGGQCTAAAARRFHVAELELLREPVALESGAEMRE